MRPGDGPSRSVLLAAYDGPKGEAFSALLEAHDMQGGGYSFAALLAAACIDAGMELDDVAFDPEGDMLSVSFPDEARAERAAILLRRMIDDPERTKAMIGLARTIELPEGVEFE